VDSLTPTGTGHTRRSFISRAGLLGGGLWLVLTGWDKTIGRAAAALAPSAQTRHRQTYAALTDAVAASDANGLTAAQAAELAESFDEWYTSQPDRAQRTIDSVLEDLDGSLDGKKFHKADRSARLNHLREATRGGQRDGSRADKASARRVEQIRENARKPEYRGDPTDFSSAKAAPPDRPPPPKPDTSPEAVQRTTLALAAVELAVAPLYLSDPTNPEDLAKVPPVSV
jgi:hypothetical protein